MQDVVIYTTRFCPYCIRAKQLLDSKGVNYREIAVDNKPELRAQMAAKAGRRSVPQIWVGDFHVGGCDDLMALERNGKLNGLLKSAG
ncbi:glutaredoxin 3 [Microbulbifer sp. DLAB2-AF]|uniref:glutaredoxin 3 n=1 Tax=unclassified Microbulbifer TaxID=2619833 RepID=UPI004039A528